MMRHNFNANKPQIIPLLLENHRVTFLRVGRAVSALAPDAPCHLNTCKDLAAPEQGDGHPFIQNGHALADTEISWQRLKLSRPI